MQTKPSGFMDAGLGDQSADDVAGQLLVHIEPHMSELEADVSVELVGGNGVESLMIELGAVAGLVGIGGEHFRLSYRW